MRLNISIIGFVLSALLVIFFGFFLFQLRWVAMACLSIFFILSFWSIWSASFDEIRQIFGFNASRWHWIALASLGGTGLAIFYRWYQGETLYPDDLSSFALTAIMIGITEEVIFRGYFLGKLFDFQQYIWALITSAILHTAYKTAIFFPFEPINLISLGGWTFLVGLLLAHSRRESGSIWPCVVFHALFDFWVYGDNAAPWWIW